MSIDALFVEIDRLTAQAHEYAIKEDFEPIAKILTERLVLFKKLAVKIENDNTATNAKRYTDFLTKHQDDGQSQINNLLTVKEKLAASRRQQSKATKAVAAYQKNSV